MAKCSQGCGETLAAGITFGICPSCKAKIRRLANKPRGALRETERLRTVQLNCIQLVRGPQDEGPKPGGYVSTYLVRRRARMRDEKKRGGDGRKIQHFPSTASQ